MPKKHPSIRSFHGVETLNIIFVLIDQVAELLTGVNLASQLRVPAVSRLQKVHNTDVALKALRNAPAGVSIPATITSKDLVDGQREKTLTLLWSLIFGFQLTTLIDVGRLREEVAHLKKSLRVRARLGDERASQGEKWLMDLRSRSPPFSSDSALEGKAIQLLKEWSQLVTAHYNIQVGKHSSSFLMPHPAFVILGDPYFFGLLGSVHIYNMRICI